jgi:acetyl/propionyl-CoA carboxylase alpha subunit
MIFLRASAAVYEQARAAMDAARGLPAKGQLTSFTPAASAPTDAQGRVYLALRESDTTAPGADQMIADLVTAGYVEVVTEADYMAALPQGEL